MKKFTAVLCLSVAVHCLASDVRFNGTCDWQISGSEIEIEAGEVVNYDTAGSVSGSLRLVVWATFSPYFGGDITGYELGEVQLDPLAGGEEYTSISDWATLSEPPAGTYYTTITVEEYDGAGYVIDDYVNFDGTTEFGDGGGENTGGGGASDIAFNGNCGWQIDGDEIELEANHIENNSAVGSTSGTLLLVVWATATPYEGGEISGYILGSKQFNPLPGTEEYNNVEDWVALSTPPDGDYYTTMTIEEYTDTGYVVDDYVDFPSITQFGTGGSNGNGGSGVGQGGNSGGGRVQLAGDVAWRIDKNRINISAGDVVNSTDATAGPLRLRVWATSAPYVGGQITGYVLGTHNLSPLKAGREFQNINSEAPYKAPPTGSYYTVITLEQYHGQNFQILDYVPSSAQVNLGPGIGGSLGGNGGGLALSAPVSVNFTGENAVLKLGEVSNERAIGQSGSLQLQLWGSTSAYAGSGSVQGYLLANYDLNPLSAGFYYYNLRPRTPYTAPPAGTYYLTLILAEQTGTNYTAVNYLNLPRSKSFN